MADSERHLGALFVGSGAVLTIDGLMHADLHPSRYIALIVAFVLIVLLAQWSGDLASALAWLVFLAILLTKGQSVLTGVTKASSRGAKG